MSSLYDRINDDLKQAMLKKDHKLVSVLKVLKSTVLYAAVESGSRDNISDEQVTTVLRKEAKKRDDASALYGKAGDKSREESERYEKEVIDKYLPKMLSEEEVTKLVDKSINKFQDADPKMIGKIISDVKNESKGRAEGSLVAKLVKERLNK